MMKDKDRKGREEEKSRREKGGEEDGEEVKRKVRV